MSTSTENKHLAQIALKAFGSSPTVFKYWDDNNMSSIDILSCVSEIYEDVQSFSTLGLSDFSIGYENNRIPLRVELVGASDSEVFPNILSTCAFNIINSKFECYPGAIFKDVVNMYLTDTDMKHILFVAPFLWENKLETVNFEKKQVTWLMVIPISEEERKYADKYGFESLEELFEGSQINVFDLKRISVI